MHYFCWIDHLKSNKFFARDLKSNNFFVRNEIKICNFIGIKIDIIQKLKKQLMLISYEGFLQEIEECINIEYWILADPKWESWRLLFLSVIM